MCHGSHGPLVTLRDQVIPYRANIKVAHVKRLKELEEENGKLKQMYADVSLDNRMLKDVLSKKF